MGFIVQLDTVFTDETLPIFYPDSRMNKGSLFLLDFSHPDQDVSAVPANGATLNNIAWENAKKLIPSGIQSTLSSTIVNTLTTPGAIAEITPKKGLHVIISQVNDTQSGNEFQIILPTLVREYIHANISRGFFISIWDKKTRLATTATTADFALLLTNTTNYVAILLNSSLTPLTGNLGRTNSGNVLGNRRNTLGINIFSNTPTSSGFSFYKFGSGFAYASAEVNHAPSQVLYHIHIADLTSAKIGAETLAEACTRLNAKDLVDYNAAFGVGGRFYGDTNTDPSTLP